MSPNIYAIPLDYQIINQYLNMFKNQKEPIVRTAFYMAMSKYTYGMDYDNGGIYDIIYSEIIPQVLTEYPNGDENGLATRLMSIIENIAIYFNSTILPYRELKSVNDVHPFGNNVELIYKDYIPEKGLLLVEAFRPFELMNGRL